MTVTSPAAPAPARPATGHAAADRRDTPAVASGSSPPARRLRRRWLPYLFEAVELGLFMVSASIGAILLFHPASTIAAHVEAPALRRLLMGLAMGATAVALIYSPLGRRSGAHMNPAVTLTFLRLGKIAPADALFYVLAQAAGGTLGIAVAAAATGTLLAHPSVNYVVTVPSDASWAGLGAAWLGELVISFILMLAVLTLGNRPATAPLTGVACGVLVASFIFLESPISGTSLNPARTGASAIMAGVWTGWWIYLTAPPLAMLLAAELYVRTAGLSRVYCAKLFHDERTPCSFRCRFHEMLAEAGPRPSERPRDPSSSNGPDHHVPQSL